MPVYTIHRGDIMIKFIGLEEQAVRVMIGCLIRCLKRCLNGNENFRSYLLDILDIREKCFLKRWRFVLRQWENI